MKATGIVRKVDNLDRIVLPSELREVFDIKNKDPLEIFVEEETIILKKYLPACVFCGSADKVKLINSKYICKECADEIKSE